MSLGVLYKAASPGAGPTLLFDGERLPREVFGALSLADSVLREAEAAAAQLRAQTSEILNTQRREAHAQGLAQGRAEGMVAVLGTLEVERRMRELLASRLADVVEHCVRSVLGELGPQALLRQRVLHLVRTAATPGVATLYVCPEQLVQAQAAVAELAETVGGDVAGMLVVSDAGCAPDALRLETKVGFVEASLELTLQDTRDIVVRALTHASQQLEASA